MLLILNFAMDIRIFRVYLLSSFYIWRGSLGREPRLSYVFSPCVNLHLENYSYIRAVFVKYYNY